MSSRDAEHARRLPDEVVGALRHTGINRLLLPVELRGMDAPVVDIIDIVEQVATADGSTAWCAAIGAGSNLFAGYLPRDGARRVFADRDQGSATMLAPAGTLTDHGHGYRLLGRWPFTSNCLHSEWIGLGALHADDPGALLRSASCSCPLPRDPKSVVRGIAPNCSAVHFRRNLAHGKVGSCPPWG
jgi:alkylation response protein AidB-like acyl-CoA dehydrogenase